MHILKHNAAFLIWELQTKLKSSDWKFEMLISEPQIHRIVSLLILPQFFENHIVFSSFYKNKNFICLFVFIFWLHWVFVALCGLSLVAVSSGYSLLRFMGFSVWGFSCCRGQTLGHMVFSSCSSQARSWAQ